MTRRIGLWWVTGVLLCLPLISMVLMPLSDTSEPRYAEIARLMAQSGDWITPWFEPGKPFWGKPPLSFWAQALSFRLLGVNEFAVRFPSWLSMVATVGLLIAFTRAFFGRQLAQWAAVVYSSCALVYITSGAVLTDPFLVLGTTFSMTAFMMARHYPSLFWRYGFFVGLAIGLLAKGPLALVLVAGPLLLWLLPNIGGRMVQFRALPWTRGLLLTALISLPWYVMAEIKTPGFLNYFIVGEHFLRFIDPGWQGDLYGTAHEKMHGTIWWYWLQATFPWGLFGVGLLLLNLVKKGVRAVIKPLADSAQLSYLLAWALFTPLFFTFSGNILWTYILPCLGAFSILMALGWRKWVEQSQWKFALNTRWIAALVPLVLVLLSLFAYVSPNHFKTEKGLVHFAALQTKAGTPVYYVDERPFSARFYSGGTAELLKINEVSAKLDNSTLPVLLAIPKKRLNEVVHVLSVPVQKRYENKRYILFEASPGLAQTAMSIVAN